MGSTNAPMSHFSCWQVMVNQVSATMLPSAQFARRIGDFEAQKSTSELLHNPFTINVESAPVQIQMELIKLQWKGIIKANDNTVNLTCSITKSDPALSQTLCMFGSTYLCEVLLLVMNVNKTSHRIRLTDEHNPSWESPQHRTRLPTSTNPLPEKKNI